MKVNGLVICILFFMVFPCSSFSETVCYTVKDPSTNKIETFPTLDLAKTLGEDKCLVELSKYVCEYQNPPLPPIMCTGRRVNWTEEDVLDQHVYILHAIMNKDGGPEGLPMICSVVTRKTGTQCDNSPETSGQLKSIKSNIRVSQSGLNLFTKDGLPLTSEGNGLNSCSDSQPCKGDPINISTGLMWHPKIDFTLKTRSDLLDVELKRTYLAKSPFDGVMFGPNWHSNLESRLYGLTVNGMSNIVWGDENGLPWIFIKQADGTFKTPAGFTGKLIEFSDHFEIKDNSGTIYSFSKNGEEAPAGALISKVERHGERVDYNYSQNGRLIEVNNVKTGKIIFTYNDQGFVSSVLRQRDNLRYSYFYDVSGNLIKSVDFQNTVYLYSYVISSNEAINGLLQTQIDPLKRITKFTYDSLGRAIEESENGKYSRSFSYESTIDSSLTTVREISGAATKYYFDDYYRLKQIVHADGGKEFLEWNDQNRVTNRKDQNNFVTNFEYDLNRNISQIKRPEDSVGISATYDSKFNLPIEISYPSRSVFFSVDAVNGNISQVSSQDLRNSFEYDDFGNVIKFDNGVGSFTEPTNDFGLKLTKFDSHNPEKLFYDNRYRISSRSFLSGRVLNYSYDDYDRVILIADNMGPSVKYSYDILGRLLQKEIFSASKKEVTIYQWDSRDRLVQVTDNLGRKTQYQYNAATSSSFVIDKPSAIIAPDGKTTVFKYDIMQRLVQKIEADSSVTKFEYNLRGDLIKLTDAEGNYTRFEYDGNRRVVRRDAPTVITDNKGVSKAAREIALYTYDDADHLVREVHQLNSSAARQTVTNYSYDELGRLISKTSQKIKSSDEVEDSKTSTFSYEPILEADLLKTADNEIEKLSFEHESLPPYKLTRSKALAVSSGNPLGLIESDLTYSYDSTGELALIKEINGSTLISYTHNPAGQLIRATSGNYFGANSPVFESLMAYDDFGRKVSMTNSDGLKQALAYDQLSRLNSINWTKGNAIEMSQDLTYDHAGNIVSSKRENFETIYKYDQTNQLISENSQLSSREFAYDRVGNRVKDSIWGNGTFIANALVGDKKSPYAYNVYGYGVDGLGNLTTIVNEKDKTQKDFSYNLNGKLNTFQYSIGTNGDSLLTLYYYDALDRRVAKNIQMASGQASKNFTQAFAYLGDEEKILFSKNGNQALTLFVDGQGIDEHLGEVTATISKSNITDHLGSVLNTTSSTNKKAFGAFGEKLSESEAQDAFNLNESSSAVVYGFAGREFEFESGLYYNRARNYDPRTGRFISEDPIGFAGEDTNLYRYVNNNPITKIDPSGLSEVDVNRIRYQFWRSVDRMNRSRLRRPGTGYLNGVINNFQSSFGVGWLGCGEQAQESLDDIVNDVFRNGQFDDKWTFEIINVTPFHQVLRATSSNSQDPLLFMDPWSANFDRK